MPLAVVSNRYECRSRANDHSVTRRARPDFLVDGEGRLAHLLATEVRADKALAVSASAMRCASSSDSASSSASASASASPGGTSQPVSPGDHGLARAAVIGGDHRAAHRLRLDDDAAERFGIGRGGDHDVGQHVGRRHVAAMVDEADDAVEAAARSIAPRAPRGSRCGPASAPTSRQHRSRRPQPGERLDQHESGPSSASAGPAASRSACRPAARHASASCDDPLRR